jgi:hypothetical protein
MRYALPLYLVLAAAGSSAAWGESDRIQLAQSQTVAPAPQPQLLPQSSTTNACVINCDTVAMNCTNGCIVVGPTTSAAANTGQCNLSCTTQQLVCKSGCSSTSTGR